MSALWTAAQFGEPITVGVVAGVVITGGGVAIARTSTDDDTAARVVLPAERARLRAAGAAGRLRPMLAAVLHNASSVAVVGTPPA